jgi:hypothetical protein
MVEGPFSVRLGLEMVSHHLGKVEGPRSKFGNMAMCHICLYAYVDLIFKLIFLDPFDVVEC